METQSTGQPEISQRRPDLQGSQVDRLWEEIGGVKTLMASIAGEKVLNDRISITRTARSSHAHTIRRASAKRMRKQSAPKKGSINSLFVFFYYPSSSVNCGQKIFEALPL